MKSSEKMDPELGATVFHELMHYCLSKKPTSWMKIFRPTLTDFYKQFVYHLCGRAPHVDSIRKWIDWMVNVESESGAINIPSINITLQKLLANDIFSMLDGTNPERYSKMIVNFIHTMELLQSGQIWFSI